MYGERDTSLCDSTAPTYRTAQEASRELSYDYQALTRVLNANRRLVLPDGVEARHIRTMQSSAIAERIKADSKGVWRLYAKLHPGAEFGRGNPIPWRPEDLLRLRAELGVGFYAPANAATFIVSVANQKGGVGKTTTATTRACEAAWYGLRVLLIDLDPQGSATTCFLIVASDGTLLDPSVIRPPSIEALRAAYMDESNSESLLEMAVATHWKLIDLVPSSPSIAELELELTEEANGPAANSAEAMLARIKRKLDAIDTSKYDLIIIDTPPSIGTLQGIVSSVSHGMVIPVPLRNLDLEALRVYAMANTQRLSNLTGIAGPWFVRYLTTMRTNRSISEDRIEAMIQETTLAQKWLPVAIPRSETIHRAAGRAPGVYEVQTGHSKVRQAADDMRTTFGVAYKDVIGLVEQGYINKVTKIREAK